MYARIITNRWDVRTLLFKFLVDSQATCQESAVLTSSNEPWPSSQPLSWWANRPLQKYQSTFANMINRADIIGLHSYILIWKYLNSLFCVTETIIFKTFSCSSPLLLCLSFGQKSIGIISTYCGIPIRATSSTYTSLKALHSSARQSMQTAG